MTPACWGAGPHTHSQTHQQEEGIRLQAGGAGREPAEPELALAFWSDPNCCLQLELPFRSWAGDEAEGAAGGLQAPSTS